MPQTIQWGNTRCQLSFEYSGQTPLRLSSITVDDETVCIPYEVNMVEILAAGRGSGHLLSSSRLIQTSLGEGLRFVSSSRTTSDDGTEQLCITLANDPDGVEAKLSLTLPQHTTVCRCEVTVTNLGQQPLVLESVVPFATSFGHRQADAKAETDQEHASPAFDSWNIMKGSAEWLGEGRWSVIPIREACPYLNSAMANRDPEGAYMVTSDGTFSTGTSMPVGIVYSDEAHIAWAFQIEHNGAWRWEVGENLADGYIAASGPTWIDHGWGKTVQHGESFTSVPVSFTCGHTVRDVIGELTRYRRVTHLWHGDLDKPKVVFNDYMNTLNGDPTTDKLLPLIKAASTTGADVFCIDCGWYDDTGFWWPSVGEWQPSTTRFPNGLSEVTDAIRDAGMVPGLWLEPESIGMYSPVADKLPDEAFFLHDGMREVEQQRYMLDLRHPAARAHVDSTVDRLIEQFGIGYFKFDFNVRPGPGTTANAHSAGDGLLEHNRAYADWIDDLRARHPDLLLESCSSGAMRSDFVQSSRFDLLSTSDQQDYQLYPVIAAAAPMMMLPEQCGNWAYPEHDMDVEQFAFALANTMLGRYYLSGYVNRFSDWQNALVRESIGAYREHILPHLTQSVPFWPLGLPRWTDQHIALGMQDNDVCFVTVWARNSDTDQIRLPMPQLAGKHVAVELLFPAEQSTDCTWSWNWNADEYTLDLHIPQHMLSARVFALRYTQQ
ncbi:glycosidase [Bifidobacterium goeldii]|uniref:Glycosidase n=1 Tax=Bifidobacterium goeldii TaxID=2306975 RepID=A0A430FJ51_9BIFI|nr:glycoside hydrolase family 36 protein [Bifidobacterium goeldii]RSX52879.1 glycosidase [Bifidobacterium goeldii]